MTTIFVGEVTELDISYTHDVAVIAGGRAASEPAASYVGIIDEAPR